MQFLLLLLMYTSGCCARQLYAQVVHPLRAWNPMKVGIGFDSRVAVMR